MATLTEASKGTRNRPRHSSQSTSAQKSHIPTSSSGTKTQRLTENKRRYRARRKEYISDLEIKLAEAREQGVQATKEVQLAARQVALKNERLRNLLQLAGFSDADIDNWQGAGRGDHEGDASMSRSGRQLQQIEQKARRCATALASCQGDETVEREWMTPSSDIASGKGQVETVEILEMAGTSHSLDAGDTMTSESNTSDRSLADTSTATTHTPVASLTTATSEDGASIPEAEKSSRTCHSNKQSMPPCKLLTRLAENPAADITQVPVTTTSSLGEDPHQDAGTSHRESGVECRKAYDMLMQYATTEEKMDTIARVLESGCTMNGKGGCAVKSAVVLQALDDMCG